MENDSREVRLEKFNTLIDKAGYSNSFSEEAVEELFDYYEFMLQTKEFTIGMVESICEDWSEYESIEQCLEEFSFDGFKARRLSQIDNIYIVLKSGRVLI